MSTPGEDVRSRLQQLLDVYTGHDGARRSAKRRKGGEGSRSSEVKLDTQETLRDIKSIARASTANVDLLHEVLMSKLTVAATDVRVKVLDVMHEIFMRSAHFRHRMMDSLHTVLDYTIGPELLPPLGLTLADSLPLRSHTLGKLEMWYDKFGSLVEYKVLRLAYQFLRNTRKLQFPDVRSAQAREERQRAQRLRDTQRILLARFKRLRDTEFEEHAAEMRQGVAAIRDCFSLLFPSNFDHAPSMASAAPPRISGTPAAAVGSGISPRLSADGVDTGPVIDDGVDWIDAGPVHQHSAVGHDGGTVSMGLDTSLMDSSIPGADNAEQQQQPGVLAEDDTGDAATDPVSGVVKLEPTESVSYRPSLADEPILSPRSDAARAAAAAGVPSDGLGVAARSRAVRVVVNMDFSSEETPATRPIFDALRELHAVITKRHAPLLVDWLDTLTRLDVSAAVAPSPAASISRRVAAQAGVRVSAAGSDGNDSRAGSNGGGDRVVDDAAVLQRQQSRLLLEVQGLRSDFVDVLHKLRLLRILQPSSLPPLAGEAVAQLLPSLTTGPTVTTPARSATVLGDHSRDSDHAASSVHLKGRSSEPLPWTAPERSAAHTLQVKQQLKRASD